MPVAIYDKCKVQVKLIKMARQSTSDNVGLRLHTDICTVNRILPAISNLAEPPLPTNSSLRQLVKTGWLQVHKLYSTIQGTTTELLKLRVRKWLDLVSKTGLGELAGWSKSLLFQAF